MGGDRQGGAVPGLSEERREVLGIAVNTGVEDLCAELAQDGDDDELAEYVGVARADNQPPAADRVGDAARPDPGDLVGDELC